jgi:hypothetical protein
MGVEVADGTVPFPAGDDRRPATFGPFETRGHIGELFA